MPESFNKLKIVYLTPALYMAGGIERVLTLKANYFAEHFGYDITIILTEGKDKPLFYPLSEKVKVINLNIGFEELWTCSFLKKIVVYLKKQRQYRKMVEQELMRLRPDITISLLRREINFLTSIKDGSRKIGELHVNRANYRNFEAGDSNCIKNLFARFWMRSLVGKLKRLDSFVVLTKEDQMAWPELSNICVIPDPLSFQSTYVSPLISKRVIAVGRYVYQKGFDLLLAIDMSRCHLESSTSDIQKEYCNSSVFVFSSRFEGFGMVLVEAMACGLPVISFDCPCGPKDIVSDGEDGLLVENGNVEALADALSRLMGDEALRQLMSKAGQRNVQRFRMEQVAERWRTLLESN